VVLEASCLKPPGLASKVFDVTPSNGSGISLNLIENCTNLVVGHAAH
jgi:hypothetical protein